MSSFGNVPAETLADAVEKCVAKMGEAELASLLYGGAASLPPHAAKALVACVFEAFRDRGESSEDAAEGAHTTLAALEGDDRAALAALVRYAGENTGLLREALEIFAREHPSEIGSLPQPLIDGIAQRL